MIREMKTKIQKRVLQKKVDYSIKKMKKHMYDKDVKKWRKYGKMNYDNLTKLVKLR